METDKRKNAKNKYIEIKGSFPRPNPALMKAGVSYLNQAEKTALEREKSFNALVEDGKFIVHEIKFKDLPEELQKSYDLARFQKLKETVAKEAKEAK
jgi:hypothetical protein